MTSHFLKSVCYNPFFHRFALSLSLALVQVPLALGSEPVRIAAASDLRYAMEAIKDQFHAEYPGLEMEVIYGSSGRFRSQIENGAPFDLYFSADIAYPKALKEAGLVSGDVMPYGRGRLVLWSRSLDASAMTLADLKAPDLRRIAIANPRHAPYGARAREALVAAGVWPSVEPRLVFGENIAQTMQLVHSEAAEVGLVALSLVLSPSMEGEGSYSLIDSSLHQPLAQGFVITRRAADNAAAQRFADFFRQPRSQRLLEQFGFELPANQ